MGGKRAKSDEEVKDVRSEPTEEGILDDSSDFAIVRHGRFIKRVGEISRLSQICVQKNGGDTVMKLIFNSLSKFK